MTGSTATPGSSPRTAPGDAPGTVPGITLAVQVGPGSVRRLTFTSSPLTFGRDADNDIVLSTRFASRRHGELRYEKGKWWLVNQSANGSALNGKRVTNRLRALTQNDVVSIGEQPVFEVLPEPASSQVQPVSQLNPDSESSASNTTMRRARPWIAVGIFNLALLGFAAFLMMAPEKSDDLTAARQLLPAEIAEAIRANPPEVTPDERLARSHLEKAHELFHRPEARPDALYQTYVNYRLALAYLGQHRFPEGIDDLRFRRDVEQRLIDEVTSLHQAGYTHLGANNFEAAEEAFRELQQIYPVNDSIIFQNAKQQRSVAVDRMKRRR